MEQQDWHNYSPAGSHLQDASTPAHAKLTGHTPFFHDLNDLQANTPKETAAKRSTTQSGFSENDHYFLHQIEHNLYQPADGAPAGPPSHSSQPEMVLVHDEGLHMALLNGNTPLHVIHTDTPGHQALFGMENMDFMLPELGYEEVGNHQGQPQQNAHHHLLSHLLAAYPPLLLPQNTPSMIASDKKQPRDMFALPILPGQNEKSYNNQHYYHRNRDRAPTLAPYQLLHVRPDAVFTPLVSPAVTPMDSQVNINKFSQPIQALFEPLTLPALNAQNSNADRRRLSSLMFAPADEQPVHKRRTPHSTPTLLAANSSLGKGKRSPSVKNRSAKATVSPIEKLPESSIDLSRNSTETTPMLPPQGKKIGISSNGDPNGSAAGPATLMGFTMGRLAELQHNDEESSNNSSPSLKNSNKSSRKSSIYSSKNTSANKVLLPKSSSSSETSPILDSHMGLLPRKSGEKPSTKKASHKLAEQGRRNRMNVAVHELSGLIPQGYHEEVSIPSKATTVELASKYIRDLVAELEKVKG